MINVHGSQNKYSPLTEVFYQLKSKKMFGLFKKKSEREVLLEQYQRLLKESHSLSTSNRMASDKKRAEAEEIMDQVDKMDGK